MNFNITLPDGAASGAMPFEHVDEMRKALEAGYGTDVASLTGGGALRIQSLESTLLSTIQENSHFCLFNALQKSNATATVDEWTEQNSVGGRLGGSTNTESGIIADATGNYERRAGFAKYLMTRRQVTLVQTLQGAIAEAEAVEQSNGALQLLSDAEFLCFEGDSTVVPTEIDGIHAQITGLNSADHIIDAEAQSLNSVSSVMNAAATIASFKNFGRPTDLFTSPFVQADFDKGLDPAYRVALDNNPTNLMIGAPVTGIRTSHGNIKLHNDVFVRDETMQVPEEIEYAAATAALNATQKPQTVTPVAASDASSKFGASHAGLYYYAVCGVSASGHSTVLVSAQVTVAAGDKVTLTIVPSAARSETGYAIYRGRKNGTNAVSDLRLMTRIPTPSSGSAVYVDLNRDIPGTTKAYVLNMQPGAKAITWRQFLPMLKFPLYPTNAAIIPWAQLLFGFLRLGKRRHHVVIKNILPDGAVWRPFG